MNDEQFAHFSKRLRARYFLLEKRTIFYFLGGAAISLGGFLAWVGLTLETIRSSVSSRVEAEVDRELASFSQDAAARAEEIDALARSARQTVDALAETGGLLIWTYDNGEENLDSSFTGARMVVIARPREDGRAHSVPVDHDRLEQLCGDVDGCLMRLGAAPFTYAEVPDSRSFLPTGLHVPRTGGGCTFFYSVGTGHWSLDNQCTMWRRALRRTDEGFVDGGGFRLYSPANAWGIDGSAASGRDDVDREALPLMSWQFACYLYEAPPDGAGRIAADAERGFHLVFAGVDWEDFPLSRFSPRDPERYCLLIIDD